jgi:hypothetical protein
MAKKADQIVQWDSRTINFNPFEGQIDTGNMMQALLKKCICQKHLILNQQTVTSFVDKGSTVEITWEL